MLVGIYAGPSSSTLSSFSFSPLSFSLSFEAALFIFMTVINLD